MKLRIKGNSLRLRLTRSEVEKFCSSGYLEDRISFGTGELLYSLTSSDKVKEISAGFSGSMISVIMPLALINGWQSNEIVGFDSYMTISGKEKLYILIEKDFQCLESTEEDQSDNYENPNKNC